MSFLSAVGRLFLGELPPTEVQTRSDFPSWEQQIAAFHRLPQPWSVASPDDAMSVPAIFRAVSLIANTIGMLNLETFRNGTLLTDPEQIPRITVRPNPRSTPRVFWRDTGYYLATRGEAWWWVARRDSDGNPISLFPVPPWEIVVEPNQRNRLDPTIRWADRVVPNDDMRHITYLPDHEGLRGVGPLQLCGAAVSVAVESQAWAANFFSGSIPSIVGETEMDLDENDAAALDQQWGEKPSNLPRWLPNGIRVKDFGMDPAKAQLTDVRRMNDGQAAVMFGIPGSLLEYSMPGSSLTYQNLEGEYTKFARTCLQPNYLVPMEQEMSDLLTRSHSSQFAVNEILRTDLKTRSEVYKNLIESGVASDVAAHVVGFETMDPNPGNVAPVPFTPPLAQFERVLPDVGRAAQLPMRVVEAVRCDAMRSVRRHGVSRLEQCNKLLAESGPFVGTCPRCKTVYAA